jgi:uncharacterized membrane protein
MKEAFAILMGKMTFMEWLMAFGAVIIGVVVLLMAIAYVFDKLDVKSFSFTKGFTFYQEGDVKRARVARKAKRTVKK